MPQLRSFRLGWQSQNLAKFLLYRFCFLAEPVQVADDIGIDFFCTAYEVQPSGSNDRLLPRSSFAIQIKSDDRSSTIDLTGYLPYLSALELPFLIGIVNRDKLSLTMYSGELLTPFFAYRGTPQHLQAELCARSRLIGLVDWHTNTGPNSYSLLFPRIAEVSANTTEQQLGASVKDIREICSLMLDNIASSIKKEFILKGAPPHHQLLFAGPESFKFCEANHFERLAEVFFNLNWAHSTGQLRTQVEERFRLYENIYLMLASHFGEANLPSLLSERYKEAKSRIGCP